MGRKFPLFRNEISINDNLLKYDYLRSNYWELLLDWETNFKIYYEKEVVNEKKLKEAFELFTDELLRLLDFSVFILMESGIDYIDQSKCIDMIQDEFPDFAPFYAVEKSMNAIATASEELAQKIQTSRSIERNSRSHWEGGGFGLKGALKGAFTAGALNMATSAIRGVGDSITDSRDKAKFDIFIKDALQNSEYRILYSFITQMRLNYHLCFITMYHFLAEQGKMPALTFDIESYEAKINNYMKFGNFDKAYDLLTKSIQITPYATDLYKHLYSLADKIAVNENERELFVEEIDGLREYFRPDVFEV